MLETIERFKLLLPAKRDNEKYSVLNVDYTSKEIFNQIIKIMADQMRPRFPKWSVAQKGGNNWPEQFAVSEQFHANIMTTVRGQKTVTRILFLQILVCSL